MNTPYDDLVTAAMALPWSSRMYLADVLLVSLDGAEGTTIDRDRIIHAKRRVGAATAAAEEGRNLDEVYEQFRAELLTQVGRIG
jgi:hypothetical protein